MTELNDQVVTEFRANAGVVSDAMGGHFKDIHLLLLHHTGRRSGRRYVTPLLYVEDGDRYVLVGSNGGAEKEPVWVAPGNLSCDIPVGTSGLEVGIGAGCVVGG